MRFDPAECAGLTSGLVGSAAAVVYIRDIFRGGTRPNRATWWILTLLGAIIAASHYSSGAKQTMWLALVYVLIPLVVALVSIRRGEGGCTRFDRTCILAAGISLILWWVLQKAVVALAINLLIDFLGLLPTIRKAYLRPHGENRFAWTLALVASLISLAAVAPWKLSVALYPIYMAAANGLIAGILWLRPRTPHCASARGARWILLGVILLTTVPVGPSASAVEVFVPSDKRVETKPEQSRWTGDAGLSLVTAYFAYGIRAENRGVIAQPYLNCYYVLYEDDGTITKVSTGLQLWSSIHSKKTDAEPGSAVPLWYEYDYYVPLAFTFTNGLSLSISYFEYDFPNGAFETLRGVNANIGLDHSGILGAFALHPHITTLYNFEGVLGLGQSNAWYAEIGVAPTLVFGRKSTCPITATFPISLGLGDQHFYPGDRFGFLSAGVNLSMPLTWISGSLGNWTVNASVVHLRLGDATAAVNTNRNRDADVGQVGVGFTF